MDEETKDIYRQKIKANWDEFTTTTGGKEIELCEHRREHLQYINEMKTDLHDLRHKLKWSEMIISKYRKKNKTKRQIISKLEQQFNDEQIKNKTQASRLSDAQRQLKLMSKEILSNRKGLAEQEQIINSKKEMINSLEQATLTLQTTSSTDCTNLEEISRLQDENIALATELSLVRESQTRCELLLTAGENKNLKSKTRSLTPFNEGTSGLLTYVPAAHTDTTTDSCCVSTPSKRPDRVINRQREKDYWIPTTVFTFTSELLQSHFPKAKAELFYNYLVECSKVWREHYNGQLVMATRSAQKTISTLRNQLKVRRSKIDQLEAANTLRELKSRCDSKYKSAPYISHKVHVKDLLHACNAIEACLNQIACLEESGHARSITRAEISKSNLCRVQDGVSGLITNITNRFRDGADSSPELEEFITGELADYSAMVTMLDS